MSRASGNGKKRFFYFRLAADNIRKNGKSFVPWLMTCVVTVAMYYIICSLSRNEGLDQLTGAATVNVTLNLGCQVVAIFAVIFLFYTNSFLMKRRKKEFGLFNILGMEKKHLFIIVTIETLYAALISLAGGLLFGIALDKVMYMVILRLMGVDIPMGFYISWQSILQVMALFGIIFLLILLNSLRQIQVSNPIELLSGANAGEKEPRTKLVMSILGLGCLIWGYYISVTVEDPLTALTVFFGAVLLVIAGTYLLFIAGSITLLKLLRKNKRYYYRPANFINVSGMIYRMKQNAVGLANICILSTMVLVMISSTSCLIIGVEDIINTRYPYEVMLEAEVSKETVVDTAVRMEEILQEAVGESGGEITSSLSFTYLRLLSFREENTIEIADNNMVTASVDTMCDLVIISLEDYNRLSGQDQTLAEGQIMIYSDTDSYFYEKLNVFGKEYQVAKHLKEFPRKGLGTVSIYDTCFMVMWDESPMYDIYDYQKEIYQEQASPVRSCLGINLAGGDEQQLQVYHMAADKVKESRKILEAEGKTADKMNLSCRADSRDSAMMLYGGLFFLGIFLGLLFLMATVLIIYYKQISEGYDDRGRYAIMQKVGMSHEEVKRSIHSQIIKVFFLPLILAGLHVIFAFPVIDKIMVAFSMTNTHLFIACTAGCFLLFALLYAVIYLLTARVYYKIIS